MSPWKKLALVIGAGLYTLSPLDLIPDPLPIIGWLDDAGVIAYVVSRLRKAQEGIEARVEEFRERRNPVLEG